ncbi:hypothetical protein [Galactobacter caseinivorans]|uniref:hypothetical protein n=1 Tax=Galactobacter caseinivorans TaxID=2676123 RepID=UPI001F34A19E|nr:hypothetical protein [Galactobacter caseinivorans]
MSDFDLLGSLGSPGSSGSLSSSGTPGHSGRPVESSPPHHANGPESPQCSRKGCRQDAAWALLWNNPKIHTPQRRKTWLACPEHRDWLTDYLSTRGFFREAVPVESLPRASPPAALTSSSSPTASPSEG